jgi:ATP-binding cassette subfamily B protein
MLSSLLEIMKGPTETSRAVTQFRPTSLVKLDSSIDLSGKPFSETLTVEGPWLIVRGQSDDQRRDWPLDRIDDFRLEDSVGSCFLQGRWDDRWMDILRIPGRVDTGLLTILDKLKALAALGRPSADDSEAAEDDLGDLASTSAAVTPDSRLQNKTTSRAMNLIRPFRQGMILLLILSVGAVLIDVVPPMLQRILVDDVLQVQTPTSQPRRLLYLLLGLVGGLLLLRLSAMFVAIWKGWVSSRVGAEMTARLRTQLVEKLSQLPLAFYDRNQVGKLMSQVAYDTETLHTLVYHLTSGFLLQSLQLVGIGVMLFVLNPKLAAITLLPMPLIVGGGWFFTRYLHPLNQQYWEAVGKQAAGLMGMLSGIQVVKGFVQEGREMQRFCESSSRLRDSRVTVDVSISTFTAAMGMLFAFGTLAVWYIGGRDVLAARMTLGSLVAFLAYLAMFYTPLSSIAESTSWFASFFSTMQRMSNLMDAASEATSQSENGSIPRFHGRVEFHNVTFGYDKARPVLQNVNLSIAPGEMVGVVGRSGSGKSTLVSLINRLYEIDSGVLRIDGIDVRLLNPHDLRRQIGLVPQAPFLFRGSVAANIAYGNPDSNAEQILLAAHNADAHEFIMRMPLAYDTQLGEGGSGLSGGERQRLSIARALLFDPAILILDEATASVDAESERTICEAIRRWAGERTVILIAHRLSTLQDADRLFVFDQGRLLEQGTHAELIERRGLYQKLAQLQFQRDGSPTAKVDDRNGSRTAWLDPNHCTLEPTGNGVLRVVVSGCPWPDAIAARAFPATLADSYISLRQRESSGRERELGMIRSLAAWPPSARIAVQRSLDRRYLLQHIDEIRQIRGKATQIALTVTVGGARKELQVDNRGENSRRFGDDGLLLFDVQGSYYVIGNRSALPVRQRKLLDLYFVD